MRLKLLALTSLLFASTCSANLHSSRKHFLLEKPFTVINYNYQKVTDNSQKEIQYLLKQRKHFSSTNDYINFIGKYFLNRSYGEYGAQGEGDWCGPLSRGCVHIKQDPVYRTDQFNCQTLVQVILGLIESHSLEQFDNNIVKIIYGATGTDKIAFYNRNNFVDPDWNRVNQIHGFLTNATSYGILNKYVKTTTSLVDRNNWFKHMANSKNIKYSVRVLDAKNGSAMRNEFADNYPNKFYSFNPERIVIDYLPKTTIVTPTIKNKKITYVPNQKILDAIPTPSVIEIVRDSSKWIYHGLPIKRAIGTNSNISHMGIAYRKHFNYNEVIYQKVSCLRERVCIVKPVHCIKRNGCNELMFLHATVGYPRKYYFYNDDAGNYYCTAKKPYYGEHRSLCNRVIALPLQDYLLSHQYGKYIYMDSKSLVGIHIEKINN